MKLEKVAATAEIISSIAIVVTLAYLAVQTQQTNEALFSNSRQVTMNADLQLLQMGVEQPEILTRVSADGRNADDAQVYAFLGYSLRIREFAWYQYQSGILDERTFDSYMKVIPEQLSTEDGRWFWTNDAYAFGDEFVAYIDELIDFERP